MNIDIPSTKVAEIRSKLQERANNIQGNKPVYNQPQNTFTQNFQNEKKPYVYYEYDTRFITDIAQPGMAFKQFAQEGWEVVSYRRCYEDLNPFRPGKNKLWGYEFQLRRLITEYR
jgi:hypothetical protein